MSVAEGVEWVAGTDASDEQEASAHDRGRFTDELAPLAERHRSQHAAFEDLMRAPSIVATN